MNYQSAFKTLMPEMSGQSNMLVVPVILVKFLNGDLSAAMHLYQIFYWAGKSKSKDGVFYKRYAEWKDELFQPIDRLRMNVAKFVGMGILKTEVKRVRMLDGDGNPTKRCGDKAIFYEIDWEVLEKTLLEFIEKQRKSQNGKSEMPVSKLVSPTFQTSQGDFPIYTEITTEIRGREDQSLCPSQKSSDRTSEVPSLSDEEQDITLPLSESNGSSRQGKKKQPSSFDVKAASIFAEVVKSYRKVQRNSDLRQWANTFRQMREIDKVSEKDIREAITWYRKYIGEDYIPEAFSAVTFRKKFAEGMFTSAMKRCSQNGGASSNRRKRLTRENMWNDSENVLPGGILKVEVGQDGREYDGQLLYRVRRRVLERFGRGLPLPEELQTVLDEEFPDAEDLPLSIIGRVG